MLKFFTMNGFGRSLLIISLACFQITIRVVNAGMIDGSIDFGYKHSQFNSDGRPALTTETFNQRYHLSVSGDMYRSWLGNYRIGGTLAKTDIDGEVNDTETILSAYSLTGKLLPISPFPLSWYYIKNETDVLAKMTDDSEINTSMYGADLHLDFRQLPTTTIFYYGQETDSTLSLGSSEQSSATSGIDMKKRWGSLNANLRYEHSDYDEKISESFANADRLSTSWTYRPSSDFHTSFIASSYNRIGNNPGNNLDPLYSDIINNSSNLSILWNPDKQVNFNISGNYFLEEQKDNSREAKDGRGEFGYRFNDNISLTMSGYAIRTNLNQEEYASNDYRTGLNYNQSAKWFGLELRGNAGVGYFSRETVISNQPVTHDDGSYYQAGAGLSYPWNIDGVVITPYYDFSYGRGKQFAVNDTLYFSQEAGLNADGIFWGGRFNSNVSYRETRQEDGVDVISEQTRAYADYNHSLWKRANTRFQVGYTKIHGEVVDNLFTFFTQEQETDFTTYYGRLDFSTPIIFPGLFWNTSIRVDSKYSQDQESLNTTLVDSRLSQQFGKLFYELGYYSIDSEQGGLNSSENIWFVNIKRTVSIQF